MRKRGPQPHLPPDLVRIPVKIEATSWDLLTKSAIDAQGAIASSSTAAHPIPLNPQEGQHREPTWSVLPLKQQALGVELPVKDQVSGFDIGTLVRQHLDGVSLGSEECPAHHQ